MHHDDDFSFINPCVKYSLFFFNLIFWILGGSLVGLGTWSLLQEYNETATWVNVQTVFDLVLHISLALILIGSIVFSMSFAGCLGALRENLCLLKLVSSIQLERDQHEQLIFISLF
jgi:tetraspanin-33